MLTAAQAYAHAKAPTASLTRSLVDTVAQELANALGGSVSVCLPGNIRITREPLEPLMEIRRRA